ncbi:MAG TPA: sensor histidine kinase [Terracidiphilus sp.]|nr:sensor histidine kinase [Terracidiphilus sp.]
MLALHTPDTLERTEEQALDALIPALIPAGPKTSETLADVAHDARNMVTALGLYCDLLDVPGVLSAPFQHYGSELKVVVAASRRLVEKLAAFEHPGPKTEEMIDTAPAPLATTPHLQWNSVPPKLIDNLAAELKANRNLLSALAGPNTIVTVDIVDGALPVNLTGEDFTRILVNLVKNAAEAMPEGGRIHLTLLESFSGPAADPVLILNIEDNGPGFSSDALNHLFEAGFSVQVRSDAGNNARQRSREHRGLGLSITRSIVEAAGGRIHAANRDPVGACFQIELPVRVF